MADSAVSLDKVKGFLYAQYNDEEKWALNVVGERRRLSFSAKTQHRNCGNVTTSFTKGKWRSAVALVRNPRRRFRHVADLVKRSEAQKKRKSIQENDIDSKLLPNNFSSFDALLAFSF
ncbi:hypothetical protein F8388_013695 [Cannabis sativa]|uniref:Calcium-transporting P-type ATPase N-terminal autoinhibitory domain-containing protein n=1 Tax=Cannabis sativa TaxID=3483 RepID=A0A7J6EKJ0_CANSA|nr:hypothetical protein G4B88_015092 [Cannabis sativa]KAF4358891.1 hypothetical protein F8388_013695 [Cannabis sativa]